MPNFLEMLRLSNIFNPQIPLGNDLPSQGGITGNMSLPANSPIQSPFPTGEMFPPRRSSPFENISFGAEQPITPIQGPPAPNQSPSDIIAQRMREIYQPSTVATDKFNQMVGQYPEMDEYKPSWLRRIGSMIAAFGPGGQQAGMELMYRPYTEKLTDWKNQIGPLQQAANLERQENVNERTLAYQTISQQLRAEADEERARNNERNAITRQQRADVYQMKAMLPNHKFNFDGPMVIVSDPRTGEVRQTDIPTGSLSDADKLTLQQQHALGRISATGEQAKELETLRQTGREGLAETRGWQIFNVPDPNNPGQMKAVKINQITGEVQSIETGGPVSRPTSGTGTGRGELPTQTKVRQYLAAKQLVNTNPKLARWIEFGPGANEFTIVQPDPSAWTEYGRGPTPDEMKVIQQAIYGSDIPIAQPGRTNQSGGTNAPTTPQGKVLVISPDGRRGYIPQAQLKDALAQGYKQVQ